MSMTFNPTGYATDRLLGDTPLGNLVSLLGLDAGNAPILLMLGKVKFSLNTLVFNELTRQDNAKWAAVSQIGRLDAQQYMGPGPDVISLPGVLFPNWRGSEKTLETLHMMLRTGGAYNLIGANGTMLGAWTLVNIEERRDAYHSTGTPRRIEFVIALQRFAEADPHQDQTLKGLSRLFGDVKDAMGAAQASLQGLEAKGVAIIDGGIDAAMDGVKDIF